MNTNTKLVMKSTAELNAEVLEELKIPDPEVEAANALLQPQEDKEDDNEDSTGDDRGRGNTDNPEDSE
jgi:hypothetical protein